MDTAATDRSAQGNKNIRALSRRTDTMSRTMTPSNGAEHSKQHTWRGHIAHATPRSKVCTTRATKTPPLTADRTRAPNVGSHHRAHHGTPTRTTYTGRHLWHNKPTGRNSTPTGHKYHRHNTVAGSQERPTIQAHQPTRTQVNPMTQGTTCNEHLQNRTTTTNSGRTRGQTTHHSENIS